jgi:DNA-binding NarL/FixJ family response regulator
MGLSLHPSLSGQPHRPASGTVTDPAPRTAATVAIARGGADGRANWRRAILEPYAAVEADTLEALRELLASRQPAVLLLDAALPGLNGPAGLSELRQHSPQLRTIVLGDFRSDSEELAYFRAGARACCRSDISLVLLARAVDAVLRGEVWIRRALTGSLVTELAALEAACVAAARGPQRPAGPAGAGLDSLTARERQIAAMLARGDSDPSIARQLSLGERTVKAYVSRALRKSGAGDRARLALLFGGGESAGR